LRKYKHEEKMISTKAQMKTEKSTGDHVYLCSNSAPLQEVYEALTEFRTYVYGRMKEAEEQQKAAAEAPAEQPQG
jgi:hypothetical protein